MKIPAVFVTAETLLPDQKDVIEKAFGVRPLDYYGSSEFAPVLALATGLGMVLGAGLALLRQMLDQRLKSVEHVSALLGLPVLGVIPAMSRRENPSVRGQITCLESQSHAAEAYRTVRTAVFFGAPKTEAKTVLVTSAAPGEGKSTTASNLAIAMAAQQQRLCRGSEPPCRAL